jgi:protein-S-isoprenylcysteine O-methyltransferase Ste14
MPSNADTPKYVVPPPLPPIVALVLIVVLDLVAPVEFLPQAVSLAVGIPLLVAGAGLWAWGFATMVRGGENPTTPATSGLVTTGPYRFSRNPIYAFGITGILGLAVLLDTASGVAVVAVLLPVAYILTLAEERYLEEKFGDQWRDYCSRVRRWI